MHEQTAVVSLVLGDGAATNLTIHLHIHAGPAVAPVNGEPPRSAVAHTLPINLSLPISELPTDMPDASTGEPSDIPGVGPIPQAVVPDTIASRRERCKDVAASVSRMTAFQRRAFALRRSGLDWAEVGKRVGLSEPAAAICAEEIANRLGPENFTRLTEGFTDHLANRDTALCVGCHWRCHEVFLDGEETLYY
jgi:hypothetical protein